MRLPLILALVLAATPTLAQPAQQGAPADAMASFDKELDALFATTGLTADQAATRAVKASPTVQARTAAIDIAIAQAEMAELVRVPRVGVSATYTRLSPIDSLLLTPDPNGPKFSFSENSYATQASLGVALSDYVLRYPKLIEAALLGAEAARIGKRGSELDAAQEARIIYYEWVRSRLQVLIATRQLTQVRATLGQVRALADAQRVSKADLMRVESQEAQIEQVADQLRYLSELREEQLRLLIDATAGEPLAIGEDIRADIPQPATGRLDDLMASAVKQRLEFRVLDVGIRAKEKQREAERAGQLPKLSAFASADYARPNQRVFPQVDEFRFTWQAGVQLSWTLNEALVTRAQDRRFGAEIRELRADRDNLQRGTRIAVLAAQQAVELARRSLATSQKGLAAAEESYRVRQALLAAQRATAVELVDAETELTRARIASLNARVDLRVALVQLAHAVGADAATR
ncbi:MAG: TolC family protein [Deltaproteobacteria bacterium]|nr:TolC family protein [Deltaproteobacteria bacterium]